MMSRVDGHRQAQSNIIGVYGTLFSTGRILYDLAISHHEPMEQVILLSNWHRLTAFRRQELFLKGQPVQQCTYSWIECVFFPQ